MNKAVQTVTVNRPAQEAFNFAIDPNNTPKWVSGVVKEVTNETPSKLGTIYKNQAKDGSWAEFEITDFESGVMFEMTKKGDNTHVKYTFNSLNDHQCELEYLVRVSEGELSVRFSEANIQNILQELKTVIENQVQ